MRFDLIDKESWPRREYFEHYFQGLPCTYSMTVKLDITPILERGYKLYPAMLHTLTAQVNCREEFRTAFNSQGQLGIYSEMLPIFTMGRYQKEGGKILMPLAAQVHHGVCDGFHLCRFLRELQERIDCLPPRQEGGQE